MTCSTFCSRCESIPDPVGGPGRLFLWSPLRHSVGKMLPWLRASEVHYELRETEECLVVDLENPVAQIESLTGSLSVEEMRGTRALLLAAEPVDGEAPQFREPSFADFPKVSGLDAVVAQIKSGWLLDMLSENRITSFFQPIVHAREPGRVYAHEALLRGRGSAGELVSPGNILPLAKTTGMLFQVDRAARLCAIRESQRCNIDGRIFINFMPTSIYDPVNCLRSTVALIRELDLPPERFVFEVVESEEVESVDHLLTILKYYRKGGFGVALDDLGAGYSSLNRMAELRPDFVKLDMKLIQGVHRDPVKAMIAERLLLLARDLGIQTIVEGVEDREELAWAQEHGADFVQGYLIARPNNPPDRPAIGNREG